MKSKAEYLNEASRQVLGMTFLSALYKNNFSMLDIVEAAMEAYARDKQIACLQRAAEKAKVIIETFTLQKDEHINSVCIPDQNCRDLAIFVDKDSITSKDNLL